MSVEDCLEGRVIRSGISVKVNERNQFVNKEVHGGLTVLGYKMQNDL